MQEENTERTFQLELEQPELLKVLSMAAWDEKTVSELHTCYSAAEPATVRDCSALEATGTLEGIIIVGSPQRAHTCYRQFIFNLLIIYSATFF